MNSIITIPKFPMVKPKGWLNGINKVVQEGIPNYADSKRFPNVVGTLTWRQFWEEELYKIINGVEYGGIWIPGRYYYYLNYKQMSTIKGVVTPDMTDLHLELAYYIEYCKSIGRNLICAKGRRKGISEAASTMIVDYGWRFFDGYKAGVAAGNKTYVDDFLAKWRFSDSRLPPELSTKKLVDNDDEIVAGYSIKNDHGYFEERGTFNTIYARTMHINPNMFKGLYLNDVIAEEVGEFEKFLEFFSATKDTLMSGNKQVGMMTAFGTGGQINKGSRDFQKAWHDANSYNFERFLIPATKMYYYGGAREPERRLPIETELYKTLKPYELIGYEDSVLAEKDILARRELYLKHGNKKAYNEDLQNNPLNEEEIFRKTVINNFNSDLLNKQRHAINILVTPKWSKYKLDWVRKENGDYKIPYEVKYRALKPHEDQDECVWILDGEFPRKGFKNRLVAGLDSYDINLSKASKSLGAMCVFDRISKTPIAVISCRPARREAFYDLCMKLAVMYDLKHNVLLDIANGVIIPHFDNAGLRHYFADRPKKFESENSEQVHDIGVRLTGFSKPRMVSLMESYIEDYCGNIWFPELINQLGNYDEVEIGSDNDLADALGLALMQDVSCDLRPRDTSKEDEVKNRFELPRFEPDGMGGLRPISNGKLDPRNIQADRDELWDLFGKHQ